MALSLFASGSFRHDEKTGLGHSRSFGLWLQSKLKGKSHFSWSTAKSLKTCPSGQSFSVITPSLAVVKDNLIKFATNRIGHSSTWNCFSHYYLLASIIFVALFCVRKETIWLGALIRCAVVVLRKWCCRRCRRRGSLGSTKRRPS